MKLIILIPGNMIGGGVKMMVRLASHLSERHDVTLMYPLVNHYTLNHRLKNTSLLAKTKSFVQGLRRAFVPFVFEEDLDQRVRRVTYMAVPSVDRLRECDAVIYPSVWQYHELKNMNLGRTKKIHWSIADYLFSSALGSSINHILEAYRGQDVLVAPSAITRTHLESYGFKVKATIPGGIDPLFHAQGRPSTGSPPRLLGYYQPAWWVKGGATLVQVLQRIRSRYPEVPITLFGHQNSSIASTGSQLCDRFVTGLSSQGVADLCRAHDIFLYPSYTDGFQSPPLEAMACGMAVVATRVGAAPEYIRHGDNGLLCEAMDPDGLFREFEKLLSDPSLSRAIGTRAAAEAGRWNWATCADKFDDLLAEIV